MSTIAFDGKMISADRQASSDCWAYPVSKLFKLQWNGFDCILGVVGHYQDGLLVRDWLQNGGEKPVVDKDTFAALLVKKGICCRMEDKLVMWSVEAPHAIGSGRDFALAVMECGKTAEEAVIIATKFDPGSGLDVDTIVTLT